MRYRMRATFCAATAAAALAVPTTSADASATGGAVFVCRARFGPLPTGGGTCGNGPLVPGVALGVDAGLDNAGDSYVVTGLGTFTAAFGYVSACLLGTANGTATIFGLTAVHTDISNPFSPFVTVVGATITTSFTWVRVGLTAVIVMFNTRVTFTNGHFAVSASPVSGIVDSVAVAAFAPLPPPLGPGVGNCLSPTPTDALVVGTAVTPI